MDSGITGQSQRSESVLSPSTLARYFFQDCAHFLRFRTAIKDSRKRDGIPNRPFDTSSVMQALQDRGAAWEEEVLQTYLADKVLAADGAGRLVLRQHSVDVTLRHLRAAQSLYQPTLRPKPGALGIDPKLATFTDIRPDLIQVRTDSGRTGPLFQIIDIKSASVERFTRRFRSTFMPGSWTRSSAKRGSQELSISMKALSGLAITRSRPRSPLRISLP